MRLDKKVDQIYQVCDSGHNLLGKHDLATLPLQSCWEICQLPAASFNKQVSVFKQIWVHFLRGFPTTYLLWSWTKT